MRIIAVISLLLLLSSCKKQIIINIENKPPQLVVNAEISADSLLWFKLALTQNITDNGDKPLVEDAFIEVFDRDTTLLDNPAYAGNGTYVSGLVKAEAGKTYIFRLNVAGKSYWVTQRIPDSVKCRIADTSRIIFQGRDKFFQLELSLDDPSGENYYGVRVKRLFKAFQGADTVLREEWVSLESIDFILTENPKSRFSKQNLLFADQYFNGVQQQSLKFGASGLFTTPNQKTTALIVYTTSYTRAGYLYYTSVNEHIFYQNDPFSQPTLVQGNIAGAYGAVIGKYHKVDTVRFK